MSCKGGQKKGLCIDSYPLPTLTMPLMIRPIASRLSQTGPMTTTPAARKVQAMPIPTHAASPRTPKIVCAKKSGRGMARTRITS